MKGRRIMRRPVYLFDGAPTVISDSLVTPAWIGATGGRVTADRRAGESELS
jgi:hypothetical protein